jgi:hypothetical protein
MGKNAYRALEVGVENAQKGIWNESTAPESATEKEDGSAGLKRKDPLDASIGRGRITPL